MHGGARSRRSSSSSKAPSSAAYPSSDHLASRRPPASDDWIHRSTRRDHRSTVHPPLHRSVSYAKLATRPLHLSSYADKLLEPKLEFPSFSFATLDFTLQSNSATHYSISDQICLNQLI
ncbi:hypothetical protein L2E82_49936 [Cichorium intybus]|nr:hypothetical protein L2E82_49936 [Cichorium intybus]